MSDAQGLKVDAWQMPRFGFLVLAGFLIPVKTLQKSCL